MALATACGDDDSTNPCNNDGVCDADETTGNCPNDCPICVEDGTCDSAAGENGINCPADCGGVTCDLSESGDDYDFLASQIFLPDDQQTSTEIGMDLDGDGLVDNKLGVVIATLAETSPDYDVNAEIAAAMAAGEILIVLRQRVDQFGDDDAVVLQVLKGVIHDASPIFDGNDELELDPSASTNEYLCGSLTGDELRAGPDAIHMPFPLPGMGALTFHLQQVQVLGETTETGWTSVLLGGGVPAAEIDTVLYPALLGWMNKIIQEDPNGSLAQGVTDLLDGTCDSSIPGCENTVPGEGECDATADPPVITETEIRCSQIMLQALAPDVDLDNDGTNDAISVGMRIVAAVPVTIVTP
ncbi:MAG: hypothetical protein ABI333_00650 [bacterium]